MSDHLIKNVLVETKNIMQINDLISFVRIFKQGRNGYIAAAKAE